MHQPPRQGLRQQHQVVMDGNGINAQLLQFYCLLKYLCSSLIDQNTQRPVCQAAAAAREAAQGEDPGPEENSQPGLR